MKTIKLLIILLFSILLFSCEEETIIYENSNKTILGYDLINQYPQEVFSTLSVLSYDLVSKEEYSGYTTQELYNNIDTIQVNIIYSYARVCEEVNYTIPDKNYNSVIKELNSKLDIISDSTWEEISGDNHVNIWEISKQYNKYNLNVKLKFNNYGNKF